MAEIETLSLKFQALVRDFESDMRHAAGTAGQNFKRMEADAGRFERTIKVTMGAAAKAAGALGITLGVGAFLRSAKTAIGEVAALGDAADRAGVSAEKLQVLRYAIEQSGGAAADADDAFEKFNLRLGQFAQDGGGPAAAAIKALGLQITDTGGRMRSTEDIFGDAVDKLSKVDDQGRRAALAYDLFGREAGVKLNGVLAAGNQGLAEQEQRLRSLGSLMSNEAVKAGQAIDDKFAEIAGTLSNNFKSAVITAAEVIYQLIDAFRAVSNQGDLSNLRSELESTVDQLHDVSDQLASAREFRVGLTDAQARDVDAEITRLEDKAASLQERVNVINQRMLDLQKPVARPPAPNDPTLFIGPPKASGADPTDRIRELIRNLEFEEAQLHRTAREQAIYNAYARAGIDENHALAGAVAEAAGRFYDQQQAVEANAAAMNELSDIAKDALGSVISALIRGEDAWKAFGDAASRTLDRIANKFLDMGIDALFATGGGQLSSVGAGLFHQGGIVGAGGPRRSVPAATFIGAPRLHKGLMPDEMPAILQRGEMVIPRAQLTRSAGGGATASVNVVINNNAGAKVSARERRTADGGVNLTIQLDEMVGGLIASQGSRTDQAIRRSYGVSRGVTRRGQ